MGIRFGPNSLITILACGSRYAQKFVTAVIRRRQPQKFSTDRKGEHPLNHLSGYTGTTHADGFAGFNESCPDAFSNRLGQELISLQFILRAGL